jgi:CheY-like chemotaxis protein
MEGSTHVLLVDDEADFLEPVAFWLRSKGYTVTSAASGQDAIRAVKQKLPDIVFLDIHMPGMDGIQTLQQLRTISKELPVIIVTAAYQDERNFATANELGISGFFPKQKSLTDLVLILEASLRAHTKLRGPLPGSPPA